MRGGNFSSVAEQTVLHNFGITCHSGIIYRIRVLAWIPLRHNEIKINCNGSSMGNPGNGGTVCSVQAFNKTDVPWQYRGRWYRGSSHGIEWRLTHTWREANFAADRPGMATKLAYGKFGGRSIRVDILQTTLYNLHGMMAI
ncbi:hypothetical protein IFM89_021296 [Coptis chinensis]|uniref:Uncharacterized protein n=1 Tax=Coptis chinensis TaxID=261450 RepID=A0A835HU16_9MAGN|nr:hypothetical protein IFM89_021296 [Coptis chinensis]